MDTEAINFIYIESIALIRMLLSPAVNLSVAMSNLIRYIIY